MPQNLTIQSTRIEIYQGGKACGNLGSAGYRVDTFNWHVSSDAPIGNGYYLKITILATDGRMAWASTPKFSIRIPKSTEIIVVIIIVVVCVCACGAGCYRTRQRRYRPPQGTLTSVLVEEPPVANPVVNQVGTTSAVPVVYPAPRQAYYSASSPQRSGYSGGTVAGAAVAGAIGGAMLERAYEGGHHHHHGGFGGGDFGGGNFGGGDFGGGDFGGGGGFGGTDAGANGGDF